MNVRAQTKDMQIRVLLQGKQGVPIWQERTIVADEKQFMPTWSVDRPWSVRSVRVDRPFDLESHSLSFEGAEYCILCPPSRRLSQHFLRAMQNERRDQVLGQRMPILLIMLMFAGIGCLVFGCHDSRCIFSPGLGALRGIKTALDCVMHERLCQVWEWEDRWMPAAKIDLRLSDANMKLMLLLWRLVLFVGVALVYALGLSRMGVSFFAWLAALLQTRSYSQEDADRGRRGLRPSLDGPVSRERCVPRPCLANGQRQDRQRRQGTEGLAAVAVAARCCGCCLLRRRAPAAPHTSIPLAPALGTSGCRLTARRLCRLAPAVMQHGLREDHGRVARAGSPPPPNATAGCMVAFAARGVAGARTTLVGSELDQQQRAAGAQVAWRRWFAHAAVLGFVCAPSR